MPHGAVGDGERMGAARPSRLASDTMSMPEEPEDRLLRTDLYEIENKIDLIETKLAALPTQRDLTRVALFTLLSGAVLVLFGIGVFLR
jgi:hypothetical protein